MGPAVIFPPIVSKGAATVYTYTIVSPCLPKACLLAQAKPQFVSLLALKPTHLAKWAEIKGINQVTDWRFVCLYFDTFDGNASVASHYPKRCWWRELTPFDLVTTNQQCDGHGPLCNATINSHTSLESSHYGPLWTMQSMEKFVSP